MFFRPKERLASESVPALTVSDALAEDVRSAQVGDRAALRRVLDAVGPDVARVARAVVGPQAAELDDIVQDALVHFVKALATFRGECSVRRFARRIAARTAISARRRVTRRSAQQEPLEDCEQPAEDASDPEHSSLATRRQQLLSELLAALPAAQAESMALRIVLGMSLAEVAEAMGVPENTVRSRLRLARETLRGRIEADPSLLELLGGAA